MAQSTITNLAARMNATAAATAAALGGTVVTSDIVALAAVLNALAISPDVSIPLLGIATTPALASTMLTPA